jgi:hypothetical protein
MQYTIPVLEFLLPEFRPIYAELMGYYEFYLRTQLWARAVYLETLKRTKDLWRSLEHPLIGSDAKIDSPVNLKGLDYRFLDDGMFCQPVGTFYNMQANKATDHTRIAINSAEIATSTLKNAGLGYHSFILTFDSGASRMSTGCRDDFLDFKTTGLQNLELDGIASGLKIEGIGIVQYSITMDDGT